MSARPAFLSEVGTMEPLKEKSILITRPLDQSVQLKDSLEQLGAIVAALPAIHIVPASSWNAVDRAISNIISYDAVILTSVNAATYFLNRMRLVAEKMFISLTEKPVYAVGEKTKRAVDGFGLEGTVLQGSQDARSLSIALAGMDVRGKKFLFPKGNLASTEIPTTLRENGADVDEVIVYETRTPSEADSTALNEMFSRKGIDVVVFFSPSSINNFFSIVPRNSLRQAKIAVIGKTTASAAKKAGLSVDIIADKPSTEELVSAIVRFYE